MYFFLKLKVIGLLFIIYDSWRATIYFSKLKWQWFYFMFLFVYFYMILFFKGEPKNLFKNR